MGRRDWEIVGLSGEVSCHGNSWPAFSSRAVSGVVGRETGSRRCRGLAVGIAIGAVVCPRREGEAGAVAVSAAVAAVAVVVSGSKTDAEADGLKFELEGLGCRSVIGTIWICGGLGFRAPSAAEPFESLGSLESSGLAPDLADLDVDVDVAVEVEVEREVEVDNGRDGCFFDDDESKSKSKSDAILFEGLKEAIDY